MDDQQPGAGPQQEKPRLAAVLAESLRGVVIDDRDQATALLAMRYAEAIDEDPYLLGTLGSKLMTALAALQLTPASRGTTGGVAPPKDPAVKALEELRGEADEVAKQREKRPRSR